MFIDVLPERRVLNDVYCARSVGRSLLCRQKQRHGGGQFCVQQTSCSVRAEGADWNGTRYVVGTVCMGVGQGLWFEQFVREWDKACGLNSLYGSGTRPLI